MPLTLGIDPGATLATSTWVLQRDGEPLEAGACDALPLGSQPSRVVIESITALTSKSGRISVGVRQGTNIGGVIQTARSEGRIWQMILTAFPGVPIYMPPKLFMLKQYLGADTGGFVGGRGKRANVSALLTARLKTQFPAAMFKRNAVLSNTDKQDAFIAAIYAGGEWIV